MKIISFDVGSCIFTGKMEKHVTVLKKVAVDLLDIKKGGVYFDLTFGNGGHTREMLSRCEEISVFCVDRDESARKNFEKLKSKFPDSNLVFVHSKFSELKKIKDDFKLEHIDGFLFDFGVSSMQLDEGDRGFSFQKDAPLSMQMGLCKISAFDVVNSMEENELADIIFKYSDEKKSRRIAKKICEARKQKKIETTLELVNIIKAATGKYNDSIHPATRTFQAIRIYVNDEMAEIENAIKSIYEIGNHKSRCVCISFHSLEDTIIKKFIKQHDKDDLEREVFDQNYGMLKEKSQSINKMKFFTKQLHKKAILPSLEEIQGNVRSRSARMRGFELLENPEFIED